METKEQDIAVQEAQAGQAEHPPHPVPTGGSRFQ